MPDKTLEAASPEDIPEGAGETVAADEDFRTFGFGHRSYQPDPRAQYSFKRWVVRLLPVNPRRRWR